MKRYLRTALIGVVLAGAASATGIVNGSFEAPTVPANTYVTYNPGDSTSIPGWTVTGSGNIALINDTFNCCGGISYNASDGHQSLDLTGTSDSGNGGGIAQTVAGLVAGNYAVSFDVGNYDDPNGSGSPGSTEISLFIDGSLAGTYTNANNTAGMVNWQTFTYAFSSAGGTLSIEFRNAGGDGNYAGLDNVVLAEGVDVAAPEPGTWATLFGGLALLVVWRVRASRA